MSFRGFSPTFFSAISRTLSPSFSLSLLSLTYSLSPSYFLTIHACRCTMYKFGIVDKVFFKGVHCNSHNTGDLLCAYCMAKTILIVVSIWAQHFHSFFIFIPFVEFSFCFFFLSFSFVWEIFKSVVRDCTKVAKYNFLSLLFFRFDAKGISFNNEMEKKKLNFIFNLTWLRSI